MSESLPDLIAKAMSRFGVQSVSALYRRLPKGDDRMTYETFRKLKTGEQRGSRDPRVVRDLQIILAESEATIRAALEIGPTYGPWELPPRAQGLNPQERKVVVEVIDTILLAKREGGTDAGTAEAPKKSEPGDPPGNVTAADFGAPAGSDIRPPTDPGEVPDWADEEAANDITEPKGRAFDNQDDDAGQEG